MTIKNFKECSSVYPTNPMLKTLISTPFSIASAVERANLSSLVNINVSPAM